MEELLNREFFEEIREVAERIKSYEEDEITVVHHNDADGLASGAILSHFCNCVDKKVERICIEKVHPKIVEKIHEGKKGKIIFYTDLAGLAADMIDKVDAGRNQIIIIDHHPAKAIESDNVLVFDSELIGISGDLFTSASTLNYFVSSAINDEMRKYAYLAVVGAVGDYHDRSGGVLGLDRIALDDALHQGQVKIKIEKARERYYIEFFEEFADVVARRLTNLGAIGYEKADYKLGVKACIHGFDEKTIKESERLEKMKNEKFDEAIERLKEGELHQERYTQWFNLGDTFSPMGVKAVGEFMQLSKDMTFFDENKYIVGFQNMPDYIPDLGKLDLNASKMSGRIPVPLERRIIHGQAPGLDYLVPKASEIIGAFADATHRIAAATVLEKGKEREFVKVFESLVDEFYRSR
ncbi:MAG: DHH family phosphoesterase [Archaeoglobus sp.]|nr:DHH family phosphoesterase [Archaeoglobus sp.]